jgi:hypothetical protein
MVMLGSLSFTKCVHILSYQYIVQTMIYACYLGVSILPLFLRFFNWIIGLFRQIGIFGFSFCYFKLTVYDGIAVLDTQDV